MDCQFLVQQDSDDGINVPLLQTGNAEDLLNFEDPSGTFLPSSANGVWHSTATDPFDIPIRTSDLEYPTIVGSQLGLAPLPIPNSTSSTQVEDQLDYDAAGNVGNQNTTLAPTLGQSMSFVQTLMEKAFDWFLIRVDAMEVYSNYLCTTNCAPGSATGTQVARSVTRAIELMRRVQYDPESWIPDNVPIVVRNQPCYTNLLDRVFRTAFKAEVIAVQHELLEKGYFATRNLLVPYYPRTERFDYPRIVLLRDLEDTETTANWCTPEGNLLWNDCYGYRLFHVDALEGDGFPAQRSIGFIQVYQHLQNDPGLDEWVGITHATDPMLAFGLAWIVAVVDADVLRNKRFTDTEVTKRRREHFLVIYRRILTWFTSLRNQVPIPGLSQESRAQAMEAIGSLSGLALPNLDYLHWWY
ncbi:hypothetical protein JVT61DRAFT_12618 [Boletus reticuloceps]|uniref:Uncharacterized protein n=1 Tax=Boletus reticuloceps TaxID=495285 RepID=A0A8I2YDK2_9AGAM|nr:hypothetical protein JVT61DRAFT_12610 [Boletus reticuloceps]KAG6369982.1 hypothetical protein JVT61DRAFT_12618 [Boletus reticuloceps]